jgi:hypothetical protein
VKNTVFSGLTDISRSRRSRRRFKNYCQIIGYRSRFLSPTLDNVRDMAFKMADRITVLEYDSDNPSIVL